MQVGPNIINQAITTRYGMPDERMLSPTNVWQIGRVILALMNLEDSNSVDQIDYYNMARPGALNWAAPPILADPWVPALNDDALGYSQTLQDLVTSCLQVRSK